MNDSIYQPRFITTTTIASGIERIERRAWLVQRMLLMPRHEAWTRREVSVRRAAGTTAIEGVGLPEQAVSELLNRHTTVGETEEEQANINALRAYEFVDYLSGQRDVPLDELVVRELNRQFMAGAPELLTPGSYRKGQNRINDYLPPDQGDVPALMRAFGLWLREDEQDIHPLVRAGLAHIHFVAVHPFWDGNGRTARALSTLVMQRSDFHFRNLLSLEVTFASNKDGYIQAIRETLGIAFSTIYDATPWLEFFVQGIEVASELLEKELTDWHRTMEDLHHRLEGVGLKDRQVDALAFVARTGRVTRRDYMAVANVRPLTASRDLADLVNRGLLLPKGRTRDRTYEPAAPEAEQDAADERQSVLPL